MNIVPFYSAKPGDEAYTYARSNGEMIGNDYGWVTDLGIFDDRDGEEHLKRQRWQLIAEDELILPDPYPVADS